MNEELKKKIEDIQKNEWATDEKIFEDLVKQGYKREDLREILKIDILNPGTDIVKVNPVLHWFVLGALSFQFLLFSWAAYTYPFFLIIIVLILLSFLGVLLNKIPGYYLANVVMIISGVIMFLVFVLIGLSGGYFGKFHEVVNLIELINPPLIIGTLICNYILIKAIKK